MERSEQIDELMTALAAAQAEYPPLEKGRVAVVKMRSGGSYEYHYIALDDILKEIRPILNRHGIAFTQAPERGADGVVEVLTMLGHSSGQWISSTMLMPYEGNTAQAFGSAVTYARRYAAGPILGLAFEEDDDGQQASAPREASARHEAQQQPANGDPGDYVWPFGTHRDKQVKTLPRGFLRWARDKMEDGPARRAAIAYLDASVGSGELRYLLDCAEDAAAAGQSVDPTRVQAAIAQQVAERGYVPRAWWAAALGKVGADPAGYNPMRYKVDEDNEEDEGVSY